MKSEKIILQKPKKENLSKMPDLVRKYYETIENKNYNPRGKIFSIEIKRESWDSGTDGMAYFNELIVEKENKVVYRSGMMKYRGAYNWEIDDHDAHLFDPSILEEKSNEVVFGLRTGAGKIKIYRLKGDKLENLYTFDIDGYKKKKERNELIEKILEDPDEWVKYIKNEQGHHWYVDYWSMEDLKNKKEEDNKWRDDYQILDDGNLIIALAKHYDRDYDPIADYYNVYFWKKGVGIAKSKIYYTGLSHPSFEKFYIIGVGFLEPASYDKDKQIVIAKIGNKGQNKVIEHEFELEEK
ncbi:MAG: hypothetical protein QXD48_00780 [Candidatus Aenigmatarchaeota archaeon]